MTKKFPLWINNCHIFAHFVQFWPCYFFSMPFYGRQPTWHEKLVKICGIANFLNFNLAKSNFWLVAICPIKRHLDYLFRMEEVQKKIPVFRYSWCWVQWIVKFLLACNVNIKIVNPMTGIFIMFVSISSWLKWKFTACWWWRIVLPPFGKDNPNAS